MIQSQQPLFSNDFLGLLKILAILLMSVLLPLGGLVVYFLKRGPDVALATMQRSLDGLGERVNDVEKDNERTKEQLSGIRETMHENQQEVLTAIRQSAEIQTRSIHAVDLQVAKLEERSNLGEALRAFGTAITGAIETIASR
ncbi:MAG TPA: hypothetical protein VJ247_01230 [Gaiella sp.]|jgi:hypothetical protein|nr:hypothetical protein [Gaiella sp.]